MSTQERIDKLGKAEQERNLRNAKRNTAQEVYDRTTDKVIEAGHYDVTETDYGGMYDEKQFTIEVTESINQKDLALNLWEDLGYRSPWIYLSIRPVQIEVRKR